MSSGFQQTEDLWLAICRETTPDRKRLLMVEMAKLLLKYAALDESGIAPLSGSETLTDYFIEYLDVATHVSDFIEVVLPHLDPELKDFEAQIRTCDEKIQSLRKNHDGLKQANTDILAKKQSLASEFETLNQLETEVEELRRKAQALKPEHVERLKRERAELQEQTAAQTPELEHLESEKNALETALNRVIALQQELAQENDRSVNRLAQLSAQLAEALDRDWDHCDIALAKEIRKLKQKNMMYRDITEKLDQTLNRLTEVIAAERVNRELYEHHVQANGDVAGVMERQVGISIPQKMNNIRMLSSKIKADLETFDRMLQDLIQTEEGTAAQIRRLAEPGAS